MTLSPELTQRVITAIVGAVILLSLILLGGKAGAAFVAVILALGMVFEFSNMTLELPDKAEKRMLLLGTTWLIAFLSFWIPRSEYLLLLVTFVGLFTYFLFTAKRHDGPSMTHHFQELMYSVFGLIYLAFLPLFLPMLRDLPQGRHWTLLFLLVVWCCDTGAYFVGLSVGKRKLYPAISPKKTVEGTVGGLASGFLVALLYKLLFFNALSWLGVLVIPLAVGVVSQIGDLCESFLKRAFHRKDSGSILPGHGGFLDRFDGVVFSLPIMYGCVRVFG